MLTTYCNCHSNTLIRCPLQRIKGSIHPCTNTVLIMYFTWQPSLGAKLAGIGGLQSKKPGAIVARIAVSHPSTMPVSPLITSDPNLRAEKTGQVMLSPPVAAVMRKKPLRNGFRGTDYNHSTLSQENGESGSGFPLAKSMIHKIASWIT